MIVPPLTEDEPFRLKSLAATRMMGTPLEERFERLTRLTQRLLQSPAAAITLIGADRQWFKSIQGVSITETPRDIAFCAHTILGDDVLVVSDMRQDPRFCGNPLVATAPHVVFYAGCPVRTRDGSKIGSVCILDVQAREMSDEDMQSLRDLAALVESELSFGMESASQQEIITELDELRRQAKVDVLTRLWNRESILQLFDVELSRARRANHGVGVIIADVDHFKRVNDTLGHAAGDEVLRQVAKRILGAIRDVDAAGRFGGEEFMVALGRCNGLKGAEIVAERIRARMEESPIKTPFGVIPVTLSLGVAWCENPFEASEQSMFLCADASLYRAKSGGRNRVEGDIARPDSQAA